MATSAVTPQIDPETGERIKQDVQIDPATGERVKPSVNPQSPSTLSTSSLAERAGKGLLNFGNNAIQGLGESAIGLLSSGDELARKHLPAFFTNSNFGFGPPANLEHVHAIARPDNTTQAIGKGVGDTLQFMIPGGAEEKAVAVAPKLLRPAAKIATSALSSGAVNKLQGGDFGTGALAGGGGAVLGEGLKAAAPIIAETGLGLPKAMRAFGKTPGKALLEETKGIRPETIAASAQERLGQLNPELEQMADAASVRPNPARGLLTSGTQEVPLHSSPNAGQPQGVLLRAPSTEGGPIPSILPNRSASLGPARSIIGNAMTTAERQNAEGLHGQLGRMQEFLGNRFGTNEPIPAQVTPRELLDLKRGLSEEHLRWNPETHDRALSTGRQAYGALDSELDRTVPGAAQLNQRISSLIPVAQRAESISRGAPTLQRAMQRFGAHTGALTLGGVGAAGGYKEGGVPGAIAGGLTGVLAPELIASPEGQVALARTLYKANGLRPIVGAGLQLDRKKDEEQQ